MSDRKFNYGAQTNPNYKKGSVRNPIRDAANRNRKKKKSGYTYERHEANQRAIMKLRGGKKVDPDAWKKI